MYISDILNANMVRHWKFLILFATLQPVAESDVFD